MRKITLVFILLLSVVFLGAGSRFVARIDHPSLNDLTRFQNSDADIAAYHPGLYLDLVLSSEEYRDLLKDYPQLRITQTEEQLKQNLQSQRDIPGYRSYNQVITELQQKRGYKPV
ncbi:MAG: hypothetical protein GXY81_04985 [Candidatus Cloacimonetes bacterium]|nr:hypothetical protein [Candidatus Cloacimonadota bacterium]